MSRFQTNLAILLVSVFSLFFSIGVQADDATSTVVVEKKVIVSPVPKSGNCTTKAAHWEGDVWIDSQTICTYTDRPEGAAWVQDYWACTAYTADGNCTSWVYKPGYWMSTGTATTTTTTTTP